MGHGEITIFFLSLALLLGLARVFGELAQRFQQPAVLGEILAGILLGPTVLGSIAPEFNEFIFPQTGNVAVARQAITTFAIVMFLLVAGMEVDLSRAWLQGKAALKVGFGGLVIPFVLGLFFGGVFPETMGRAPEADTLVFSLFLATALSISALPVIAKTLMDLNIYRTDFGILIISAAVLNDLIGWFVFAFVLSLMGPVLGSTMPIGLTILLTVIFVLGVLTVGRWCVHRALPWLQAFTAWPGGVLSFAMTLALFGAAFAEWIGVHAVFGSFMVGVAVGDSSRLSERTRTIIDQFISSVFAPLFFASIGLTVNFISHFDLLLVVVLITVACVSKIVGSGLGALWAGNGKREALAVGFGMNARGAMEIILGLIALEAGIIQEPLFVALVLMALITSMMSGPVVQRILGHAAPQHALKYLSAKTFIPRLEGRGRREAIRELVQVVAQQHNLDADVIEREIWAREETLGTGIGEGVAVPHANVRGISQPLVAVGLSPAGIDFDAQDFEPSHIIFLVLAPEGNDGVELDIISEIADTFKVPHVWERLPEVTSYVEFLSLFRIAQLEVR